MTTREGIRTRSHNLILFAKLKDSDPKVVCQAIHLITAREALPHEERLYYDQYKKKHG